MTSAVPHPDTSEFQVNCAVITVSDTRTPETDKSGQLIHQFLQNLSYPILDYQIVKDEPKEIIKLLKKLCQIPELDACIFHGGTGISPRDTTYDALEKLLEKTLPGFGEIFRALSYNEIGSRAIASRAIAGVCQGKLVFSVPGSSPAVKLAMEKLILPELAHLVKVLRQY
ncbi:MAG TPA: molybdenum cofactor biosynthesis protein [Planktothrix sp. UBA8407]|jgi:molybdenum cofactor synthesis domain|nr:molybdenum cofactor biosynthesis protein [Planktothrix sp. UBA8402]HAO11039.1 molybdenum cofactor biosynthesis protein [Planktothrix sp. UBA8407]HBK23968.1 molybdenum cofactor biosynthesis protein [Planktothrix sp. UBA10369]